MERNLSQSKAKYKFFVFCRDCQSHIHTVNRYSFYSEIGAAIFCNLSSIFSRQRRDEVFISEKTSRLSRDPGCSKRDISPRRDGTEIVPPSYKHKRKILKNYLPDGILTIVPSRENSRPACHINRP